MDTNQMQQSIRNVIHTIGLIKTDNQDGQWNKLLGCQLELTNVLNALVAIGQKLAAVGDESKEAAEHEPKSD